MDKKIEWLLKTINIEFKNNFDNAKLLLFGSRANGSATKYSDIDLAIESKNKLIKFYDFIDDLPTLYSIDLIDMHYADEVLKQQIKDNSIILK